MKHLDSKDFKRKLFEIILFSTLNATNYGLNIIANLIIIILKHGKIINVTNIGRFRIEIKKY